MKRFWSLGLLGLLGWPGLNLPAAEVPPAPELIATYTLPPTSVSLGNPRCSDTALRTAVQNGLRFTNLPSLGSGLARAGTNEFWGITDRGPNGTVGKGDQERRTFPLPHFCPTLIRFRIAGSRMEIVQLLPLLDPQGKRLTGLSNLPREERLFASADARTPLPLDESGIDPEALRVLPDGKFLVSEEYSPSVLVVSPGGRVLVRYTPETKPLPHAAYPVKAILPGIYGRRRDNKGFENLAVSPDGRWAYVIPQSALGDVEKKHFAESRILRVLKLDLQDPLNARVAGEFLAGASPAAGYSAKQKQATVSWSDAEWLAPDKLLVIERAKKEARLLVVDLTRATNVLGRKDGADFTFEDTRTDLAGLGIRTAGTQTVFSTRDLSGIDSDKLEGLAVLNAREVALVNDNDFGIGDNKTGEPSRLWIVRLAQPLPLADSGSGPGR